MDDGKPGGRVGGPGLPMVCHSHALRHCMQPREQFWLDARHIGVLAAPLILAQLASEKRRHRCYAAHAPTHTRTAIHRASEKS
ncbi:hypothetical protein BX604_4954 [Burkholderia sp. JKS000303]|nr:hypothetical protein BX604_4954 [Burkholderia sp. JKS000303]